MWRQLFSVVVYFVLMFCFVSLLLWRSRSPRQTQLSSKEIAQLIFAREQAMAWQTKFVMRQNTWILQTLFVMIVMGVVLVCFCSSQCAIKWWKMMELCSWWPVYFGARGACRLILMLDRLYLNFCRFLQTDSGPVGKRLEPSRQPPFATSRRGSALAKETFDDCYALWFQILLEHSCNMLQTGHIK
jgi:hypothetical protein